jgi:L-rhamnose isomerase/sugar isomerase
MVALAAVARPATAPALERIDWAMNGVNIEIPSWGFVNTGTRFRVFPQQGVPRSVFEKIDDAATVNRYTGIAGSVSLHIPWDKVDDYAALGAYAAERGLRIGGINSNTFQDEDYKLGSICNPDARVRSKAVDAVIECCEIAAAMNAQAVKVWLGDGTNYPGQDDLRWRHRRLVDGLREAYAHLPSGVRMYLEYKLYEPALYATDVQDWGQSLNVVRQLGEQAGVCVDTGHHAMGVNIEQIVALLLAEGRLAAFDLNDKKYGDDDLMVGSIDPYQLFRIAH